MYAASSRIQQTHQTQARQICVLARVRIPPPPLGPDLPAFEQLVEESAVRGVMCAYNSVNGTPLCANELLKEQLRGRIGFHGIVITDCGAVGFMISNRKPLRRCSNRPTTRRLTCNLQVVTRPFVPHTRRNR